MKRKLSKICVYASTILFLGFLSLYVYTLIANPNPWESRITVGNSNPVTVTDPDSPSKRTYTFHPHIIRIALEKREGDMRGCNLIFFNQDMPYELNASFGFTRGDKPTNKIHFQFHEMVFGSIIHSTRMLGCTKDDQTKEILFMGYGIFFWDMNHTINKEQNWWTLMISLWYPIILFGILPAIFVVKKLRGRKSASTKK